MRKIVYILCAAAALVTGLWGCQKKAESIKTVDLRYRANDSYDLPATGAQPFTILVASSDPWTVTSAHPDWCIISEEEGDASDAELVHIGQATPTTIQIQYYDNTFLDDRVDQIVIKSDYWTGKTITVTQAGIAFLKIPDDDLALDVEKAGGDYEIHINSNQDWSTKVTDGDWVSITDGVTGSGSGVVVVTAEENPAEMRYAEVTVYDRHDVPAAQIIFTQDGVQLVPASEEIRAGYDQATAELDVVSNSKWVVVKDAEGDDWFDIVSGTGEGDGKIQLSFTQNDGDALRKANILLRNVVTSEDEYQAEKIIVVKQAYKIESVRKELNNDELGAWTSDWANPPVYTSGVGTLFTSKARLNRSMEFGSYTFRWSNITANAYVRHWFCFSDGIEMKVNVRPGSNKVAFEFNASSAGVSDKPSLSSYSEISDWTQPIEVTYKFDPSGAEHCHVTYLVNGQVAASFDTSSAILHTVTWGAKINMYIGVQDEEGQTGNSAVCEWYEYTPPMNWE